MTTPLARIITENTDRINQLFPAAADAPAIDLDTELPAFLINELAAKYEAFGYTDRGDRLFALMADVARLYMTETGYTDPGDMLGVLEDNLSLPADPGEVYESHPCCEHCRPGTGGHADTLDGDHESPCSLCPPR